MHPEQAITIADRTIAAMNAGAWAETIASLTADVSCIEVGTGQEQIGVVAYVQFWKGWRQAFSDWEGRIGTTMADGQLVVQEIVWEGTQDGPLETPLGILPPTGRRVQVPATVWYVFTSQQICAVRHHLNRFSLLQQLGLFEQASGSAQ
jgi:predicted ester cyclase